MKINSLTTEQVFRSLVTSEKGLAQEEAARRLAESGQNLLREIRGTPLLLRFLRQFTHFLALLLWIGAGLALFFEYLNPGEGMLPLGLAIVGVILVNAVFTFIQEYRAEKSVAALRSLLPFRVRVLRDGAEQEIDASAVVAGDLIRVAEGGRVPADARLIDAVNLMVNNAPLTGESEPLPLDPSPCDGELIGSRNIVFAGTTVLAGRGTAAVFATGMQTEVGRIAGLTSGIEPALSPLQREIVKVTRLIAVLATVMGAVFFFIGHLLGRSFWENFLFCIGIIVANVPEGLLPTVTLSLAMGSQRMAKKKALIKTLTAVETLGAVTVICTDKTGTLTQNRMETQRIWTWEGDAAAGEADGVRHGRMLQAAFLCTNAAFDGGEYSGDPTEVAILKTARDAGPAIPAARLFEMPFDAERKRMTSVNRLDAAVMVFTKGAVEGLLPLCTRYAVRGGEAAMTAESRRTIEHAARSLMDQGLRVIAFASKESSEPWGTGDERRAGSMPPVAHSSSLESDLTFLGLMGLADPPRPEVADAIATCRDAGIRVIMITGDSSRTAVAVGRSIGLITAEPVVIDGADFLGMDDRRLGEMIAAPEIIFSRMTPKHKMRVVSVLQSRGERVAVTGDGVNDAPALRKADIGIAMGLSGTDVAKEAADMVLLDDNFATIVNAVEEGRAVYENIRKFISYIFSSNIPEIVPYLAYVLFRIPLPLTIMQILAVDLGTDMLPALGLGAEKPTHGLMRRPPRKRTERLLSLPLLVRAYLFLGPIEAAAGMVGFFLVLTAGGWSWGELAGPTSPLYLQATTACLSAIVITQVANVFACRSWQESVFSIGFFSNRLILAGIGFELILFAFIVCHPWGNRIFGTAPIDAGVWLSLLPFALLLLTAEEARKWIARRIRQHPAGV